MRKTSQRSWKRKERRTSPCTRAQNQDPVSSTPTSLKSRAFNWAEYMAILQNEGDDFNNWPGAQCTAFFFDPPIATVNLQPSAQTQPGLALTLPNFKRVLGGSVTRDMSLIRRLSRLVLAGEHPSFSTRCLNVFYSTLQVGLH